MRNPMRVLVVDPCPDNGATLALLLGIWGHELRVVRTGREAVEAAQEYQPDAVLMEVCLPGMDGYAVARHLRERERGNRALLVAVTGYGSEAYRQRSREAGFDYHFLKPAELEDLRQLLATGRLEARLQREPPFWGPLNEPPQAIWEKALVA